MRITAMKIGYNMDCNVLNVGHDLVSIYDIINCRCIDIPFLSQTLTDNNIDIVIDDEGKIADKKPTVVIYRKEDGRIIDFIAGECLVTGTDHKNLQSLTEKQLNVFLGLVKKVKIQWDDEIIDVVGLPVK